jgi:signal transduction histidine kinase
MKWRVVRWCVGIAGLGLGLASEWTLYQWADQARWIPDLATGSTFIVCGLVAGRRRPESRSGDLLLAAGLAWFVPNFSNLDPAIVGQVAASALFLHRGPLLHLLFTYPSGRASGLTPVAVIAGYAAAIVYPIWQYAPTEILVAALVPAVCLRQYLRSTGASRRGIALAGWAAIALSSLLVTAALAPADAGEPLLLAYDITLLTIAAALTAGLVFAWRERSTVTDLVVELGEARSSTLREALADALGDPSLQVGYWLPESGGFVDAEGRSLSVPEQGSKRSATVIEREGRPVALLVHDQAVVGDPGLVEALSSSARLAAANARLQSEVRARMAEVGASRRRILQAGDEERYRLERRLREGAQRRLGSLAATLKEARTTVIDDGTADNVAQAAQQLARTQEELDRLARGIHPRDLSERGLGPAVAALAKEFPLPVELAISTGEATPSAQACAYFICSEGLANVTKYASASAVRISVRSEAGGLVVEVQDDGVGGADPRRGTGLHGLADRVETLGGTLTVESPPGEGTRLIAVIPAGTD